MGVLRELLGAVAVLLCAVAVMLLIITTPVHGQADSCKDRLPECQQWSSIGYCDSQKSFMLLNCPVSCSVCVDPTCFDRSQRCSLLASRGNCRTQPNYMFSNCPHSCDACHLGIAARPSIVRPHTIVAPNFECGGSTSTSTTGSSGLNASGRRVQEGVVHLRTTRQVLFPGDPGYDNFPGRLPIVSRTLVRGPQSTLSTQKNANIIQLLPPAKVDTMVPESKANISSSTVSVDQTFCGATPISDRYLITAAHCVLDPDKPVQTVRLGELDFAKDNEENSQPEDYRVAQIIVHPDYKHNTLERYNDIAIIQTKEIITFNKLVFPYCLSADRPTPKTLVTGAGFGLVNATHRSSRLQEVELELVDTKNCEDIYRQENREQSLRLRYPQLLQTRDVICAAYPERDSCSGDSGGPLFLKRDGRRYLMGIVGAGASCRGNGASVLPGLYISVADHIDFIDSVLYPI